MAMNWYPVINEESCRECGSCVKQCAHGVFDKSSPLYPVIVHTDGCIDGCHGCGNLCPSGSITYSGENTDWTPPNAPTAQETDCSCGGACGCSVPVDVVKENDKKNLNIDFLYLDLNTCERCRATDETLKQALGVLSGVLDTLGYTAKLNSVNISTKELAEQYHFESSPTIRVNGVDICSEFIENDCVDCGDIAGCSVDCRVFVYEGIGYEQPPVAMIVDGILKAINRTKEDRPYKLPDNLAKFFTGKNSCCDSSDCCGVGGCCDDRADCCDSGDCDDTQSEDIKSMRNEVREKYGSIAANVRARGVNPYDSCCSAGDVIDTGKNYSGMELSSLPQQAITASLGCANPLVFAELKEGESVLDLGSGGGIDVLLASRYVGENGQVFGLDMTDEMLALANENKAKMGVTNVGFIKGYIEAIPFTDETVDVVLSNCVINLSDDKTKALSEAYRVLKPGGRLRIADVVATQEFDPTLKASVELWCSCMAGAVHMDDYLKILHDCGFTDAQIEVVHPYDVEVSTEDGCSCDDPCNSHSTLSGVFAGALIRANKPVK
ncbi:MAG: arsenite methyltransferase [Symbiobacteriaceae bacterium]|nr:arsenite methyltransferase [Symbiobacteriaceae bacterium]